MGWIPHSPARAFHLTLHTLPKLSTYTLYLVKLSDECILWLPEACYQSHDWQVETVLDSMYSCTRRRLIQTLMETFLLCSHRIWRGQCTWRWGCTLYIGVDVIFDSGVFVTVIISHLTWTLYLTLRVYVVHQSGCGIWQWCVCDCHHLSLDVDIVLDVEGVRCTSEWMWYLTVVCLWLSSSLTWRGHCTWRWVCTFYIRVDVVLTFRSEKAIFPE